MEQQSACDDKKAIWQSFFYQGCLITHRQERNDSYVSQLQTVGRKSNSFVLPLGWIAKNNQMQNQIHVGLFFSGQGRQDSVCGVWFVSEVCFSGACFNGLRSVKITVCVPRKHARWMTRVTRSAPSSMQHLTKPILNSMFNRDAAQVDTRRMSLSHLRDGCQLRIWFPAWQWSRVSRVRWYNYPRVCRAFLYFL